MEKELLFGWSIYAKITVLFYLDSDELFTNLVYVILFGAYIEALERTFNTG